MKENKVAPENEKKMSIYEYEEKYTKRENVRNSRLIVRILVALIGLLFATCFFILVEKIYQIHEYAGYVAIAVSVILFILLYIVPIHKILKTDYFITNTNAFHAKEAKRHNIQARRNIADKLIDFAYSTDGVGWYDSETIGKLAVARNKKDDQEVKKVLGELYSGSVKTTAKKIISEAALQTGIYTAISQSDALDTAIVTANNLKLVKNLIFLYGFRPSDAKLAKIFTKVFEDALIAFGVSSASIGKGITKTVGGAFESIPLLGKTVSIAIDATVQGITNGTLTAFVGNKTIKYLKYEYHLEDLLDNIEIEESDEELNNIVKDVSTELKNRLKPKKATKE